MLSTLITKLELGMRLRIMQFHAKNRNRMCAYIFNKRIIRILINAFYADIRIRKRIYQQIQAVVF